jgi:hypothetical protein
VRFISLEYIEIVVFGFLGEMDFVLLSGQLEAARYTLLRCRHGRNSSLPRYSSSVY